MNVCNVVRVKHGNNTYGLDVLLDYINNHLFIFLIFFSYSYDVTHTLQVNMSTAQNIPNG